MGPGSSWGCHVCQVNTSEKSGWAGKAVANILLAQIMNFAGPEEIKLLLLVPQCFPYGENSAYKLSVKTDTQTEVTLVIAGCHCSPSSFAAARQ